MGHLISIDNGGTFTDVCVITGDDVVVAKTLTTPHDLSSCFFDALKSAARQLYGAEEIAKLLAETDYLRYSTTAGTNAIVERRGPRIALLATEGVSLEGLTGPAREMAEAIVGARVAIIDPATIERDAVPTINGLLAAGANRLVVCLGGPDGAEHERRLKRVVLDRYPRHLLGAVPVLFSHELVADANDGRRAWTAVLNSFLHPTMERFLYGAERRLREYRMRSPLLVYSNDGSSTRVAKTVALRTYASGPRGGVEGVAVLAKHHRLPRLIGMDIGGTTTDVSVVDERGVPEKAFGAVDVMPVSFPLVVVESVGAGGSSILRVRDRAVTVGPDSVGATPGPACFGRGGEQATITDAYVLTGLFDPKTYLGGALSLDKERAAAAVRTNVASKLGVELEPALLVMEKAYEAVIAAAITARMGEDRSAVLVAFGGAGPMSACGVAEAAGLSTVLVPRLAAVFSAFGIGFGDVAHTHEAVLEPGAARGAVGAALHDLRDRATRGMFAEGFSPGDFALEERVCWTEGEILRTAPLGRGDAGEAVPADVPAGAKLRLRVRAVRAIPHLEMKQGDGGRGAPAKPSGARKVLGRDGKWAEVPVYALSGQLGGHLDGLAAGQTGDGPALIEDRYFTCRVEAGWSFKVAANGDVVLSRGRGAVTKGDA